jgi:membrane protease YdiL (CAAX protease family)
MELNSVNKKNNIFAAITLIAAAILWYILFVIKPINFWIEMGISILILVAAAFTIGGIPKLERITLRHIIIGVISAGVLYLIFFVGNIISGYLFPFKDAQILSVYSNKSQGNLFLISLALLFIIGPGEEIYWRGFIQKTFSKTLGENKGYFLAALLYAGVHITTGNFMLIIAALVCGLFWGWIYKKEKSLVPVIISHALWDVTIFVLLPVK